MHTYVHCSPMYNSKDLEPTQMPINDRLDQKMWYIYTMEYYTAIKHDEFLSFVGTWMNLQTDTRTENQTPHVLTHRWVLNNENMWIWGEEHQALGAVVGVGERQRRVGREGRWGGKHGEKCQI